MEGRKVKEEVGRKEERRDKFQRVQCKSQTYFVRPRSSTGRYSVMITQAQYRLLMKMLMELLILTHGIHADGM